MNTNDRSQRQEQISLTRGSPYSFQSSEEKKKKKKNFDENLKFRARHRFEL